MNLDDLKYSSPARYTYISKIIIDWLHDNVGKDNFLWTRIGMAKYKIHFRYEEDLMVFVLKFPVL